MADTKKTQDTDEDGRTNGRTVTTNDDGSRHVTTHVTLPNGLSLRASYDEDKNGNVSGSHFKDNSRK